MENPEQILHSLEEFTKSKPKDIPRELEDYLCFVAKTGDPVYQWPAIKSLFREKMISVITEFYETCPSVEIPPCPNVDLFNYDVMKTFILEKLDTFAAAPFTLQRICELLTTPRKEYNRIDKYMRALEKNILVVSTTEPGGRRSTENGEGIVNGLESEHLPETSNSSDINVEEMDDTPSWPRLLQTESVTFQNGNSDIQQIVQETIVTASKIPEVACSSTQDTVITCRSPEEPYVSIEPVPSNTCARQDNADEPDVSVTITAIPAGVQKRRNSVEPVVSSESTEEITESCIPDDARKVEVEPCGGITVTESIATTSQHIEDADSSSNQDEESEPREDDQEDKLPDTSSLSLQQDDNIPYNIYTIPYQTVDSKTNIVETSQISDEENSLEQTKSESMESSDVHVDTTKCSNSVSPPATSEEVKSDAEDVEITSSCKVDEVDSSENDLVNDEAEAKSSEAISLDSNEDISEKIEESHDDPVSKEGLGHGDKEVDNLTTPMEVDEDYSSSEKLVDVIRAEATSDSTL